MAVVEGDLHRYVRTNAEVLCLDGSDTVRGGGGV